MKTLIRSKRQYHAPTVTPEEECHFKTAAALDFAAIEYESIFTKEGVRALNDMANAIRMIYFEG